MSSVCCFESVVVSVGPEVAEFVATHLVILFGEGVPEELADVSVVHHARFVDRDLILVPGSTIVFGESLFVIDEVGCDAENNLRELGHVVLVEGNEPILPGQVRVSGDWLALQGLQTGTTVKVWRR